MITPLEDRALDLLFRSARTFRHWRNLPVSDALLKEIYDLAKLGPTSMNGCPARFVFIRSAEAKNRLVPALSPGNVQQTRNAPVTVIIAYDLEFWRELPTLYPHNPSAKEAFSDDPAGSESTAQRNSSLQGAYLMLAARSLGLDCGPMSGFNNLKVDNEFFSGTTCRSNFLCNIGYGDTTTLHPRGPRLQFDAVSTLL